MPPLEKTPLPKYTHMHDHTPDVTAATSLLLPKVSRLLCLADERAVLVDVLRAGPVV
jgi:hypothetical protein